MPGPPRDALTAVIAITLPATAMIATASDDPARTTAHPFAPPVATTEEVCLR